MKTQTWFVMLRRMGRVGSTAGELYGFEVRADSPALAITEAQISDDCPPGNWVPFLVLSEEQMTKLSRQALEGSG